MRGFDVPLHHATFCGRLGRSGAVAIFRIHFRTPSGIESNLPVCAGSFSAALAHARRELPDVVFIRARIEDETSSVSASCPRCGTESDHAIAWREQTSAVVSCPRCSCGLRLFREREIITPDPPSERKPTGTLPAKKQVPAVVQRPVVLGTPPQETFEHERNPSVADWARCVFEKRDLITWNCLHCKWSINCGWHERNSIQRCPICRAQQYVPAAAFAWNARFWHEKERARELAELRKQEEAEARERARQIAQEQRRAAAVAAEQERRRQAQIALDVLADTVVGAGLAASKSRFHSLDPDEREHLQTLADLADLLKNDLVSFVDEKALAEKGVAYGRPAAAAGSILSFANGAGWVGLAFGAVAIGARWLADDWKKAKAAEYQAKWVKIITKLDADDLHAFSAIFAYRYPALAPVATGMSSGTLT